MSRHKGGNQEIAMSTKVLATAFLLGIFATPAFAVPFCTSLHVPSDRSSFRMGFSIGPRMTEQDIVDDALMRLRRQGVAATSGDIWNGCIRVWVRQAGGGSTMEFYDPASLRRVE